MQLKGEDIVISYHPNPHIKRDSIFLLNGLWDYAITKKGKYKNPSDVIWQGKINVPYSPEAKLSGLLHTLQPSEELWYHLNLDIERKAGERYFFTAGAIDHSCEIFLNGVSIKRHSGGYTPVVAELTDNLLDGKNSISIRVVDPTDKGPFARGKQTLKPHGMWYRCQSGIWQSVYIERKKSLFVDDFEYESLESLDGIRVKIDSSDGNKHDCILEFNGERYVLSTCQWHILKVDNAHPWSPENPYIYPVSILLHDDRIESYVAIRTVAIENKRILLNGKEYFCNGVLDQGYNNDGLYTFTPEQMEHDIEFIKSLGFNTIRKHIKVEESFYYYLCDLKGVLVWQDMPSGSKSSFIVSKIPAIIESFQLPDIRYRRLFGRSDKNGIVEFENNMQEIVLKLNFFKCIIVWTIFNEGWGQFDAKEMTEKLRALDPTRLIDSTSGWHDQMCGDFYSRHVYFKKYNYKGDKAKRAEVLSEFGGLIYRIAGHVYNDKDFIYKKVETKEEFLSHLKALFDNIREEKKKGLAASIYTQSVDVEEESNGFVTYDREVVKADVEDLRKIILIPN